MKGNMRAVAMSVLVLLFMCDRAPAQTPSVQSDLTVLSKRVHEMSEQELGQYIAWLRQAQRPAASRVAEIALKSLGQRNSIPAAPFARRESDCVSFVEQTLALALADSRESYYRLITRFRYAPGSLAATGQTFTIANGHLKGPNIGAEDTAFLNQNHFTIHQWVPNNAWCLVDITKKLGADPIKPWLPLHHIVRPQPFFAKFGKQVDRAETKVIDAFVPREAIPGILPELRSGDVVLVITGTWDNRFCDHMGIIVERTPWDAIDPDGPPSIVHSVPPKVRSESLVRFIRRFPTRLQGLKVLRLSATADQVARQESTTMAPQLTVPSADSN